MISRKKSRLVLVKKYSSNNQNILFKFFLNLTFHIRCLTSKCFWQFTDWKVCQIMEPKLYFTRLVSLVLLLILGTTTIWRFFSLFYKTGFDIRSMISQQSFRPGSLTRNYLIYSFPAINSAVKIIFCISVVKKTDLGYVNKYIDATLIFYMYMPSYLQNAVEHPSREFHCMGMFRESNKNKWWGKQFENSLIETASLGSSQ